jgi:hypothetical protein
MVFTRLKPFNIPIIKLMSCVEELCKHVFGLGIAGHPARAAFYNFLVYSRNPDEPVTNRLIEDFLMFAMNYSHWQNHAKELYTLTLEDVFEFDVVEDNDLSLVGIKSAENLQIIELKSAHDRMAVTDRFLKEKYTAPESIRTVLDQPQRLLSFRKTPEQEVFVHCIDAKFTILNGALRPIYDNFGVFYDSELELKENIVHILPTATSAAHVFKVSGGLVSGFLIKGPFFQPIERFDSKELKDVPKLYFGLKRIEHFLISKETNPFYREIVALLEQTICLIEQRDPHSGAIGPTALEKGQMALELIFPNDKLLTLLLRELARTLASAGIFTGKVEANSWNEPPNHPPP